MQPENSNLEQKAPVEQPKIQENAPVVDNSIESPKQVQREKGITEAI